MDHDDDRDPEATTPVVPRRAANQNADGSYKIPAERLSILQAGVDKLNKRAAKLGMEPVTVIAGAARAEHYIEVTPAEYGDDGRILPRHETSRTRWVLDVRLEGTVPVIAGFAFVAKLDHLEGGNLVLRAPGWDGDLDGWRVVGSRCQHCGLDRSRAATFLVRDESGNIIQVGRQCLQDYTRSADVENAVKLFKCWAELLAGGSDEDSEGWGFGGYSPSPTPAEYLAAAVSSIRHRGFHKSGGETESTRQFCDFITDPCPKNDGREGAREKIELWKQLQPTDAQRATAAEVLAWVLASNDSSDYMHNARLACGERTVRAKTEGILASMPFSYDKAMGREQERKARPAAGPHVGAVGEKVTLKVTVRYVTGFQNDWTSGVFMIVTDENNSTLKIRATGLLDRMANEDGFKDGEWYLHGTVKRHERDEKRDNQPVTWLTRCVMRRDPFPPEKPKKPKKVKPASKGLPLGPMSRAPGPLLFDKREPCVSCPYRTDAPLELWSPEEFEGLLRNERDQMGTLYGCHEYNKRRDQAQVCIGWLLNQRAHNIPSIALRLKLMSSPHARACAEEASSPVPLYESVQEMCEANGVEW